MMHGYIRRGSPTAPRGLVLSPGCTLVLGFVCAQAMLILAFSGPSGLSTLIKVLSVFPAAACYQFLEGNALPGAHGPPPGLFTKAVRALQCVRVLARAVLCIVQWPARRLRTIASRRL